MFHNIPNEHMRHLLRIRRIEGQVRGLQQMIEARRKCIDVAHQIEAVIAALQRVEADMLRDHLALPGSFEVRRQPEAALAVRASDGWYEAHEQPADDGLPHGG